MDKELQRQYVSRIKRLEIENRELDDLIAIPYNFGRIIAFARKLLGKQKVRHQLQSTIVNPQLSRFFWRIFFGKIMRPFGKTVFPTNDSQFDVFKASLCNEFEKLAGFSDFDGLYKKRSERSSNFFKWLDETVIWRMSIQYWNTHNDQCHSSVARTLPRSNLLAYSTDDWDFMRRVNSLKVGENEGNDSEQNLNSIENFIIKHSDLTFGYCGSFRMSVLDDEVASDEMFRVTTSLFKKIDEWLDFDTFWSKNDDGQRLKIIERLVRPRISRRRSRVNREFAPWEHEVWENSIGAMHYYIEENFRELRYDKEEGGKFASTRFNPRFGLQNLKIMLLNNLISSRALLKSKGNEKHYFYCFPAWNNNTSYLSLTTRTRLSTAETAAIQEFAENLFSLCRSVESVVRQIYNTQKISDQRNEIQQQKIELERQTVAAVRASILGRNFSHVIGSHVVSNPNFVERVAGRPVKVDSVVKLLKEEYNEAIEEKSDPIFLVEKVIDIIDETIPAFGKEAIKFHQYLQGRFDFIARAIDHIPEPSEPIYFVAEVLDRFLEQTCLLDTLVEDLGYQRKNLKFNLEIKNDDDSSHSKFTSTWNDDPFKTHDWESTNGFDLNIRDVDVLVGLPGGQPTRQAFFSFLENIIRNSLKYQQTEGDYELTILVHRTESKVSLRLRDNFSKHGKGNEYFKIVNKHLQKSLVSPEGPPTTGLGIQEMKICANMMVDQTLGTEAELKIRSLPQGANAVETPIVYEFTVGIPILLAIVSEDAKAENRSSYIFESHSLRSLVGKGVHIVAINGDGNFNWKQKVFEDLCDQYEQLPYRVFIVYTNEDEKNDWESLLKKETNRIPSRRVQFLFDDVDRSVSNELFGPGSKLNSQESRVIAAYRAWIVSWKTNGKTTDLKPWRLCLGFARKHDQISNSWSKSLSNFNSDIIDLDLSYKESPKKPAKRLKECMKLGEIEWENERKESRGNKRLLVFDNHGECFPFSKELCEENWHFEKSTRYYQKFGESTPALFHHLSTPPRDWFGFSFFVHALVESCLLNVLIVDERVAAEMIFENDGSTRSAKGFGNELDCIEKSGIFPVFTCKKARPIEEKSRDMLGFYTKKHLAGLKRILPYATTTTEQILDPKTGKTEVKQLSRRNQNFPDLRREGLRLQFNDPKSEQTQLQIYTPKSPTNLKFVFTKLRSDDCLKVERQPLANREIYCDVLVFHEGALDIVNETTNIPDEDVQEKWSDVPSFEKYKISPFIVRTSGRGSRTKHFRPCIPFIEFSEISASILTSFNKYRLARGLMGVTGHQRSGGSP